MLTRDLGLGALDAYGDVVAADPVALGAKLSELDAAFRATLISYGWGSGLFPGDQVVQDWFGGGHLSDALKTVHLSLGIMHGDLYDAVLGQHVFPLDDGTAPDPARALASWNQLATDVQNSLAGVLGYMGKWGPLPGVMRAAKDTINPLNWPWWLQLGAGLVIFTYVRPLLGLLPSRRRT